VATNTTEYRETYLLLGRKPEKITFSVTPFISNGEMLFILDIDKKILVDTPMNRAGLEEKIRFLREELPFQKGKSNTWLRTSELHYPFFWMRTEVGSFIKIVINSKPYYIDPKSVKNPFCELLIDLALNAIKTVQPEEIERKLLTLA